MPSIEDLTNDQRLALRSAAANLHREFDGIFGTETIELFLATSYDQFADRATHRHLPAAHGRTLRPPTPQGARQGRRQGQRRPAHRAVPLRPQRRPLPDGARLVQPPRRRPGRRLVRRLRARQGGQPVRRARHGRGRHRHRRGVPQALDRRDRPSRRRRHHHGLRRRLPALPRQALRGLGARRPRRPERRRRPPHPRRDRAARPRPPELRSA